MHVGCDKLSNTPSSALQLYSHTGLSQVSACSSFWLDLSDSEAGVSHSTAELEGYRGQLQLMGKREAGDCSGGVRKAGVAGLSPGCHQKGKECGGEEGLCASQGLRDTWNSSG